MVVMPIITIFFQSKGLTMQQIYRTQSLFSIALFVLEVPTWYLGDKMGRRKSIIRWSITTAIALRRYTIAQWFWWFVWAEILLALGVAFISWSDTALLYDTLLENKQEKNYKKKEWIYTLVQNYSEAIAGIVWWIIAAYISLRWAFVAHAIIGTLLIPIALSLKETTIHNTQDNSKATRKDFRTTTMYALHHNTRLKRVMIYSSIISTTTLVIVRATQPYLQLIGLPIVYFGIARAILRFLVGTSSIFAHWYEEKLGEKRSFISLIIASVLGYVLMGTVGTLRWLLVLVIFQIIRWLQSVVTKDFINRSIQSHMRATVLSTNTMIGRFIFAGMGPLVWRMTDMRSLQTALLQSAAIFAVLGCIALIYMKKSKVF